MQEELCALQARALAAASARPPAWPPRPRANGMAGRLRWRPTTLGLQRARQVRVPAKCQASGPRAGA
eukprot:13808434-Alexandrium_andersonii.AAC.1